MITGETEVCEELVTTKGKGGLLSFSRIDCYRAHFIRRTSDCVMGPGLTPGSVNQSLDP